MRVRLLSMLTATTILATGLVTAGPAAAATTTVANLLSQIPVAAENTSAYDRSHFQHWIDADRDGCDTRAEVLVSESTVATTGGCPVDGGQWESYYDGAVWTLASDVDIDHMIPLSEAWDSGAHNWTADQRRAFANDLDYAPALVAVTDNVNASKSDRDPAEWMPPLASATCRYVGEWVGVKYRWNLTVDSTERAALDGHLGSTCAGATIEVPAKASTPTPPLSDAAIQAYITEVYLDLFDRAPDATGLSTWTTKLKNGTPYGEVANGITYSNEFRNGLITGSYEWFLGRSPDSAGLAHWLRQMQKGLHIEQMEAGFIASQEFYNSAGGADPEWVIALYEAVLLRTPSSSEVTYWLGRLNNGASRYEVALGFVYSTEYLTSVVDGYYLLLLDRHIDPAGKASWVTAIQRGARDEQIIASIVSSKEYITRATR